MPNMVLLLTIQIYTHTRIHRQKNKHLSMKLFNMIVANFSILQERCYYHNLSFFFTIIKVDEKCLDHYSFFQVFLANQIPLDSSTPSSNSCIIHSLFSLDEDDSLLCMKIQIIVDLEYSCVCTYDYQQNFTKCI